MPRRKRADPEAVLAQIRRFDVDVARTLRVDCARRSDAQAAKYLRAKLRQMRAGTYQKPWWLVDGASSVTA